MKILVSITTYYPDKQKYVQRLLNEYNQIADDMEIQIDVLLAQHYDEKFDFGRLARVPKLSLQYTGTNFCWENRKDILEKFKNYDYIIESDDDILVTQETIEYFLEYDRLLPPTHLIGFMIMEKDENETPYIQNIHAKYSPYTKGRFLWNGHSFLLPTNMHSACFMIDQKRLGQLVADQQLSTRPISLNGYDLSCTARCDVYFHFIKVVEFNDDRCLIHHLPNRYLSLDNETFPRSGYKTVAEWRSVI